MVISINPHERDSFNNLSRLTIKHKHGNIDTPNRFVTRNDLNAKNKIGADITLTQSSQSFIIQESVNPKILKKILSVNGYLDTILKKFKPIKKQIMSSNPLIFLYPSITAELFKEGLSSKNKLSLMKFFCEIANELELESIVFPVIDDINAMYTLVNKFNLQLIPVLNLNEDLNVFSKVWNSCKKLEGDMPIIGLKFTPYPKANLVYDLIMKEFEYIHEKNQSLMVLNSTRNLRKESESPVSCLHYSSMFSADMVSEQYYAGGGGPSNTMPNVRLFCKTNLAVPVVSKLEDRFDVDAEKKLFPKDRKLQELLERMASNKLRKDDWKGYRPQYLSRVHENVQTRLEFDDFRKNIKSNSAKDYLEGKPDMNVIIREHLKLE